MLLRFDHKGRAAKRLKRFSVNEWPSQVVGMVLGTLASVALLYGVLWLVSGGV